MKKKIISIALVLILILALVPMMASAQQRTVSPTSSTVYIDGQRVELIACKIDGSNFFMLRALAYALNGTSAQFNVGWNDATNTITLTSGQPYVVIGGETALTAGAPQTATPATARVELDGAEISLTAYNIGGSNFFRLRDVMRELDVGVIWDEEAGAIRLYTSIGYQDAALSQLGSTATPVTPELIARANPGTTISTGTRSSFAIDSEGYLYAWGDNTRGQLGVGRAGSRQWQLSPIRVEGLSNVKAVSAGAYHTMAITESGELYAWGRNYFGQLGIGTGGARADISAPTRVTEISGPVAFVSAGSNHTAAITEAGRLYVWGVQTRIGDGQGGRGFNPIPQHVMDNVAVVSAGDLHTMAIANDGRLYSWGSTSAHHGQLGGGGRTPQHIKDNVVAVEAGNNTTLALTSDGFLYVWGLWNVNAMGMGTPSSRHERVMDNVTAISSTGANFFAIRTDGSLWAWGRNNNGQLGVGTTNNHSYNNPVRIMGSVAAVSSGNTHTLAVLMDGSLFSWGSNADGRLGSGTRGGSSLSPEPVTEIVSVLLGEYFRGEVVPEYPVSLRAAPNIVVTEQTADRLVARFEFEGGAYFESVLETQRVDNLANTLSRFVVDEEFTAINGDTVLLGFYHNIPAILFRPLNHAASSGNYPTITTSRSRSSGLGSSGSGSSQIRDAMPTHMTLRDALAAFGVEENLFDLVNDFVNGRISEEEFLKRAAWESLKSGAKNFSPDGGPSLSHIHTVMRHFVGGAFSG